MQKMADVQAMTQAAIEPPRAAVQTVTGSRAEAGARSRSKAVSMGPK